MLTIHSFFSSQISLKIVPYIRFLIKPIKCVFFSTEFLLLGIRVSVQNVNINRSVDYTLSYFQKYLEFLILKL